MKKAEESERVRRSYMARNAELDSRETELEVRERLLDEREKSMQAAYSEKIAEADKLKNMFKDGLAKLNERAAEIKSAKLRDEQIAKIRRSGIGLLVRLWVGFIAVLVGRTKMRTTIQNRYTFLDCIFG